jgi:uncharacterized protein YcaQ
MDPIPVSAAAARRFLAVHHLLAPARALPAGLDGVRRVFTTLGSIQFDPLAVAGRNHDLVLQARVRDYDPAWTSELLYERRELFETYNKMLSLVPTSELPWYRESWDHFMAEHQDAAFVRHGDVIAHVLARLRDEGPLTSLDFGRGATVDWYWGPTSEVRAALEALWEAGIVGLARREGNRRYFDLAERVYPPELLAQRLDQVEQRRHKLLSRYRAHGLLGEGGDYSLWALTAPATLKPDDPPGTLTRAQLREQLVDAGEIVPVHVEGVRGTRYVLGGELPALERAAADVAAGRPLEGASVTLLAPLDPLVWDRALLRSLFDFDYVWEVYVPEAKRRWGYYVLPVLWGDRLVGRIEPRLDGSSGSVRILGVWWEAGFRPGQEPGFVEAMRAALAAYARFGRLSRFDWGAHSAERRLFGVRPRDV